ncbi:hypothetical protein LLEC1_03034 [Akanthomyces lecanii]|uniref:Uncharacterized protein n=1 Tax=Cordyceps confragosa TaxID=2714763 RepID=A0A179ICV8_CORDF|nr:hypothetical protein LLEC1_03034 [Akanthomyces lecanii]
MASIFNGFTSFFGRRAGAAETPTDAHSDNNEEQSSSSAQSVPEQDSTPSSSSAEPDTRQSEQVRSTSRPTRPTADSRGPPPSYRSGHFFSQLPEADSDDGRLPEGLTPLEQRRCVLLMHSNSLPQHRFAAQVEHEKTRLAEKWAACNLKREYWLDGEPLVELARQIVSRRWMEQGIGKDEWSFGFPGDRRGFWEHQHSQSHDTPEHIRKIDASRPFFQFMYEVAMERDHLEFLAYPPLLSPDLITHAPEENREDAPDDMHTTAYHNVRYEQWVARGIWDYSWGALPGMYWRHETDIRPLFREHFGSDDDVPLKHIMMTAQGNTANRGQRIDTLRHFSEDVERALQEWAKNAPGASRSGGGLFGPSQPPKRYALPRPSHLRVPLEPEQPIDESWRSNSQSVPLEGGFFGEGSLFESAPEPAQGLFGPTRDDTQRASPPGGGLFGRTAEPTAEPAQGLSGEVRVESQRALPTGGSILGPSSRAGLSEGASGPTQGLFGPTKGKSRRALPPGGGSFGQTAETAQGLFGPARVESQRALPPGGGLFGNSQRVDSFESASGPTQGLFGLTPHEEFQRAWPENSSFGGTADADEGRSDLIAFARLQNQEDLPPDGSLLRPFPPVHGPSRAAAEPRQGPSNERGVGRRAQPDPSAQRAASMGLFGVCGPKASASKESVASEETSSSAYGDENEEEDALEAIHRQFQALQRSTEQVLEAHRALAAQMSNSTRQRRSAQREPTRGVFSGETHQRRVLGPLPSSQRVSKKGSGKTTMVRSVESPGSRAGSVSSAATTVIWNPFHSHFQIGPGEPTVAAGGSSLEASTSFATGENGAWNEHSAASDDDIPHGQDFVIREDTQDVEEGVSVEEPRTGPTPRATAKRRRRDSAERNASQPLRRSKRRTRTR